MTTKTKNSLFSRVIKDWLTGPDGVTYDPARALWIIGMIAFLIFTGHAVYQGHTFDMLNFGLAYGGLLAGGAAGVKIKETTEPQVSNPTPNVDPPKP